MSKWRLVITSLPFMIGVLVLRYIVTERLGYDNLLDFGDTGVVLTAAALIMGLMLGGVIGDYREAEKLIPAIGGGLLAYESYAKRSLQVVGADDSAIHGRVTGVARAINDWLYGRIDTSAMWAAYDEINKIVDDCARAGATVPYVNQLHNANNGLGGALDRVDNIRSTSYIKSGYALLEFLVGVVLILMVVCTIENPIAAWLVPAAVSMTYAFMIQFIKDLDNPFGWGSNGGKGSPADVDITYWTNTYKLFQ